MGRFFASILAKEGFDIIITGPNEKKGHHVSKELGVNYTADNPEAAAGSDIVIVSVPIHQTKQVIKDIAPHVKKGSLLMDVTSLKEEPCRTMGKYADKDVEIIGTHPLFSHRVGSIEGQVFILTQVRAGKRFAKIKQFLLEHKARAYESSPAEHDKMMAVVQGLTHFAYISIGKTLQELNINIKDSRRFSSPLYELMLDIVGRIIGQNPLLYASIQMDNPHIGSVHDRFLQVCQNLKETIDKKDQPAFCDFMRLAARNFDDVQQAMGRSDKAIATLSKELTDLKELIGKEIGIRHRYTDKTHVGLLECVDPEWLTLRESGQVQTIKLSNIIRLDKEEIIQYKKQKYNTVKRDFSVLLEKSADETKILDLVKISVEQVCSGHITDRYTGAQVDKGKKSICYSFEIINHNAEKTESNIAEFFTSIGGRLRGENQP